MSAALALDHVALLVPDLERALAVVRQAAPGAACGPIEEFPGEGTREVYIGAAGSRARLLLLQPLGPRGPYARALARRGPGLHHVAVAVADVRAAPGDLPGWLLHPRSLDTLERGTLWLCRPGVGALVEVFAGAAPIGPPVVTAVEVPCAGDASLLAPLGLIAARGGEARVTLGARSLAVRELT